MIEALENAANDNQALIAALTAWRQLRDPQLASIVEHLGGRVRSAAIPKVNLHAEWLARAATAQPNDVESLLEALGKQPDDGQGWWPIRPTEQRFARLIERVRALSALPDDPRIARALTDSVRKAPWSTGWQGSLSAIYEPILSLIARISDPRSVEALEGLRARPVHRVTAIRDYLAEALPSTLASMTVFAPVDDALRTRLAAVADRLGVVASDPQNTDVHSSGEELLAAIYADPDDDGAREVYADFLLERKDPRGELIALQFAEHRGAATAKDKKRIASLIRAHQNEWLGELAIVTKNRVFRRGFLDEAELLAVGAATPDLWERVIADERLSTVRVLDKGKANEALYNRFLASPKCRSLRRVRATTSNTVEALARADSPLRIETLRLDRLSRDSLKLLSSTTSLPALHTLELVIDHSRTDAMLQTLAKSGVCARLRCVAAVSSWPTAPSEVGPLLAKLELLGVDEVRVVRLGVDVTSRREGDTRSLSITIRYGQELLEIARSLPTCGRLSISCESELPDDDRAVWRADALREALLSRAKEIEVDNVIGPILGIAGGAS